MPPPAATASRAAGISGLRSRAPAARAEPRPSASGSASSGDAARAGCLSLPCNKTPPQSSGLRGHAVLPASRTARRPAPAPTHPWRPRPHAGEGRQALTPAHAARKHCGEHWGPRRPSGKVYFRGRRRRRRSPHFLRFARRTTNSEQPGLGALAAAPPRGLAPPTSRIAQAQSTPGWGLPPERAGLEETAGGWGQNRVRWDWTRRSRCQVEAEGFASVC